MKELFGIFSFVFILVQGTIVEIPNGKLLGSYNGKYYSYTNVPYAQSPTGLNRFEAPVAFTTKWTDVRNATLPPVLCVLFAKTVTTNGIEDCLFLHVFTPEITCKRRYPVQVYIHGGAYMNGAAGNVDESFTASSELVLVTINYRLGPLGFLSSGDELISGNFGLKDQQMAMRWVHKNIHAFCGDTKSVLLSGFSAGGSSVQLHLLNPISSKYFTAAISTSGVAVNPWAVQPNAEEQFGKIVAILGCQSGDKQNIKRCLQNRTDVEIFEATNAMKVFNNNPVNVFGYVVEPKTVKKAFLTELPRDLIESGRIANTPWIASYTSRDGGYTAAEFMSFDENRHELIYILNSRWRELAPLVLFYNNSCVGCSSIESTNFRNDYSDYLRHTYMQGKDFSPETYLLLEKMFTDVMFADGTREMVEMHRKHCKSPVYMYVFENSLKYSIANVLANRSDLDFGE